MASFRAAWRTELFERAQTLFLEGASLERQGRHRDAVDAYKSAYQLEPRVDILMQALELDDPGELRAAEPGLRDPDVWVMAECVVPRVAVCASGGAGAPLSLSLSLSLSALPDDVLLRIFECAARSSLEMEAVDMLALVCRRVSCGLKRGAETSSNLLTLVLPHGAATGAVDACAAARVEDAV